MAWRALVVASGMLCASVGCAKVQEVAKSAADSAKEAVASQSAAPKDQSAPAAQSSAPSAPAVDQDEVLRQFLALPSAEITDERFAALLALDDAHREQVLKLDLMHASIQDDAIRKLGAFPNLQELHLGSGDEDSLGVLKELKHLSVLTLPGLAETKASTVGLLRELPHLEWLSLAQVPITDEGLGTVAELSRLKHLDIPRNSTFTGQGLSNLARLPALESVNLEGSVNVPDLAEGLLNLTQCKTLKRLNISACGLTTEHFLILRACPQLVSLKCKDNLISDQGMLLFKALTNLVELDISNSGVGDAGLSTISSRKLQRLWLGRSQISDQGMSLIRQFRDLQFLDLSETGIGDRGVVQLKGLRNLQELDLSSTGITDRGLAELAGLKSLKRIRVGMTGVSDAGREAIKQAIPGLIVDAAVE